MQPMGIASAKWEQARRLARNPALRARILGERRAIEPDIPTHSIVVDLKTGERVVNFVPPPPPPPPLPPGLIKFARDALRNYYEDLEELDDDEGQRFTPESVRAAVAKAADMPERYITGTWRLLPVALARKLYIWLLGNLRHDLSYKAIAETFALPQHHSNVYHIMASFSGWRTKYPALQTLCDHSAVRALVKEAEQNPRHFGRGSYDRETFKKTQRRTRRERARRRNGRVIKTVRITNGPNVTQQGEAWGEGSSRAVA